jgi:subtilisin family serine protease
MGRFRLGLLVFFVLAALSSVAQNRYVVYFKDKTATPYSVDAPLQYLSQRAIDRRTRQGISITSADFPVNPTYMQGIRSSGAKTFYASRWMNCALIQADVTQLNAIQSMPFVKEIELVAPGAHASSGRVKSFKARKGSGIAAPTLNQLKMVGIDSMHIDGIRGSGVLVGVFDSGFQGVNTAPPFQHLFANGQIQYTYDFVGGTTDVFKSDEHGTEVFSIIAGNSDGYTGGAYQASFQLYITEDVASEFRVEEFNWLFAAERADSSGVDVINGSLGYNTFDDPSMDYERKELDGFTAVVTRAATGAIERGIVVVCSAGNEGNNFWELVTPPADAVGILSVGSVNQAGAKSPFSSIGPTADGRFKPDVMALGSGTMVVRPTGIVGAQSGTSVASPIIACLAIGVIQRFPALSGSEVYESIIESASQSQNPDNRMGYGIPYYPQIRRQHAPFVASEPISIFPNPAGNGKFQVLFQEVYQQVQIEIFDLRGTMIGNHQVSLTWENNPLELDLSSLAAGSYLVRVRTKDNFKTTTLVRL